MHGKKQRDESEWGRNKQAKLRAEGKEYVTARKKVIPTRKMGDKCRLVRHCH